jgi:hypothetical protein
MRRVLFGIPFACFLAGTACFLGFFVKVARFVIGMPEVDKGLAQVAPIQRWGWSFFGLCLAGFVILFLLPGLGKKSCAEIDALEPADGPVSNEDSSPPAR